MKVVYAKQTASVVMPTGYSVVIRLGTHWSAGDAVVRAHPELFSDDPRTGMAGRPPADDDDAVETASAAPGERRAAVRRG